MTPDVVIDGAAAKEPRKENAAVKRGCHGARLPVTSAAGGRGKRKDPQAGHTGWLRLPDGAVRHYRYHAP